MTTAPLPPGPRATPVRLGREVGLAAATVAVLGVLAVPLALVVTGATAAAGVAVGVLTVVLFFGLGALTVEAVAAVSPSASLLVALLTYTLQVVGVGVVFAALEASGALGESIDRGWLAGTVIAATLVWLTAQVVAATRSRRPLYDLPAAATHRTVDGPGASAR